jgi:hypothetical protein
VRHEPVRDPEGTAMDDRMDVDPVLRSLGADLERDDPELAALLTGTSPMPLGRWAHRLRRAAPLLVVVLLTAALLLPARVTLGVSAMLLILASPLVAIWLCAEADRAEAAEANRADPGASPDP